jgi:hypothetical protein
MEKDPEAEAQRVGTQVWEPSKAIETDIATFLKKTRLPIFDVRVLVQTTFYPILKC